MTKFCRVTEATVKTSKGLASVTVIAAGAVAVHERDKLSAGVGKRQSWDPGNEEPRGGRGKEHEICDMTCKGLQVKVG